jgi:excisionase family DNA binding protein
MSRIPRPDGGAPDPEPLVLVDPEYWANSPRELQEALNVAAGLEAAGATGPSPGASGAAGANLERLTLTVEEAAIVLGISRAFAYESVRRGDIPHVRIGRRLLVPRVALDRLLDSAISPEAEDPDSS